MRGVGVGGGFSLFNELFILDFVCKRKFHWHHKINVSLEYNLYG